MNRHHSIRRRSQGRRRIELATAWSAATGGVLAALFGVLFAGSAPAAPAASAPTPVPGPVTPAPTTTQHRAPRTAAPSPPAQAPRRSSGGAPVASSGAT